MKSPLRNAILVSMFAVAGCGGGPRLDATNTQTYEASVKAMTADMSPVQKRNFAQDTMAALGTAAAQQNAANTLSKDKVATNPTEMYKPLQGMTVEQIHAKAEENRKGAKR